MDAFYASPLHRSPHACRFRPTATARAPLVVMALLSLASASLLASEPIEVALRVYPPEATLHHQDPRGRPGSAIAPIGERDGARLYRLPAGSVALLVAPGYRSRALHLIGLGSSTLQLSERLLPLEGPLVPLAELPTGAAPKSALVLPDGRVAVPLLRGPGVAVHAGWAASGRPGPGDRRVSGVASDGAPRVIFAPEAQWASEEGFVEPLLLPERDELWVSQMTTDSVHRFSLVDGSWLGRLESGGRWPKVLAREPDGSAVWVANWLSETVTRIEVASGGITARVAVGGQPRGMAFSDGGRLLWVCIFSTGEIEIIDTRAARVVDRLGLPRGAARHIVAAPDGATLYYSDMFHGTVSAIDSRARRVTMVRYVGPNANTIVLSPDGRTLVASVRGRNNSESYLLPGPEYGRLVVLDAQTLAPLGEVWGRNQPTGLSLSPDGRLLAATDFLDDNLAIYRLEARESRHHDRGAANHAACRP